MKFAIASAMAMLVSAWTAQAHAASDSPTDLLNDHWYRVELIVFTRGLPTSQIEEITVDGPRSFPARVLAFDDGEQRAYFYDLDPTTYVDQPLEQIDPVLAAQPPTPLTDAEFDDAELDREHLPDAAETITREPAVEPLPPTEEEIFAAAIAEFERSLRATSYRWLAPAALAMQTEARRLNATGTHQVLLHGAFELPVPPRDTPLPLLLQAGQRSAGQWTIEGTIAVTIGRFLHVHAQLWHQDADQPGAYYTLDEHRRMRSGELHYLDHPAFGALVRIDPVTVPESLLALAPQSDG